MTKIESWIGIEKSKQEKQQDIIYSMKKELDNIKGIIDSPMKTQDQISKMKKIAGSLNIFIENDFSIDRSIFLPLIDKLKDWTINSSEFNHIYESISRFSWDLSDISIERLTDILELNKELRPEFRKLWAVVATWISQGPEIAKKVEELKKDFEPLKNKLLWFKSSNPWWSKAALLLLPKELWDAIKQEWISDMFDQVWDMFANFLVMLFDWMAPEWLKDAVWKIHEWWDKIPENIRKDKDFMSKLFDKKDVKLLMEDKKDDIDNVFEKWVENVQIQYKKSLPDLVKKCFNKELKPEQIDKIVSKMNFKELLKDKKNIQWLIDKWFKWQSVEWNYFDAWVEWVLLPFEVFWKMTNSLVDEKIIDRSDVSISAWKWIVDWVTNYAYNAVMLFGYGQQLVFWHVDSKTLTDKIIELYNKDPNKAKEIIGLLVYRTWWPFLNLLWTIAEYIWKAFVYTLFDNRSFGETVDIFKSWMRWNIEWHFKLLEDLWKSLPNELKPQHFDEALSILKRTISETEENSKLVKVFNIVRKNPNIWEFSEIFIKEYEKLYWTIHDTWLINKLKWSKNIRELQALLTDKITALGSWLDKHFREPWAYFGGKFIWINSWSYVFNNIWNNIKEVNQQLIRVIKDDSFFNRISQQFAKPWLIASWMELMWWADRMKFKFRDVQEVEHFIENLKILGKESPSALKFIIWKSPIFIVWALSFESEDNMKNLKKLWLSLVELIPFVWPIALIKDATDFNDPKLFQAWFWVWLFALDWFLLTRVKSVNDFYKFFARPFIDIAEIAWSVPKIWWYMYKFSKDWFKLIEHNPRDFFRWMVEFIGIWLKTPKWKSVALAMLWLIWWIYWYNILSDEDIPEDIKKLAWDLPALEKYIKDWFKDLDQESKSQVIKMAIWTRLNISKEDMRLIEVNYDLSKNSYKINFRWKYDWMEDSDIFKPHLLEIIKFIERYDV
jgi:hypothetical protein